MMGGINECRVGPGPLQSPRFDSPNDAAIPQMFGIVWGVKAEPPVFMLAGGSAVSRRADKIVRF